MGHNSEKKIYMYSEDDHSYEDAMSHIIQRSAASANLQNFHAEKRRKLEKKKLKKHRQGITDSGFLKDNYRTMVLGVPSITTESRPKNININLSLKLRRPKLKDISHILGLHKKKISIALACVLVVVAGMAVFRFMTRKDDSPAVAGVSYIAPKTVFMPKNAPEGFTVGSGKKELENGAVLFTIYGPRGEEITLTQHASAPEFDQSILEGGFRFTTNYGTAYVLEDPTRTTGYLLGEDSWVLLNTTDGLSSVEMRLLIKALEPL